MKNLLCLENEFIYSMNNSQNLINNKLKRTCKFFTNINDKKLKIKSNRNPKKLNKFKKDKCNKETKEWLANNSVLHPKNKFIKSGLISLKEDKLEK